MANLVVQDRIITEDIFKILEKLSSVITTGKLQYFKVSGTGIQVQCPFHNQGREKNGSCYINVKDDDVEYGYFHCFTCNESGNFAKFVGECFNRSEDFGANWLIANYAQDYVKHELKLDKIELKSTNNDTPTFLDESILESFESYHPYFKQRKISDDIVKKYDLKYDSATKCVVFPVRDSFGRLKYLTRRSVTGKKFIIDKSANKKDIYLLDSIIRDNIKTVIVCESQINALTCESWGYRAIALFGAGTTKEQMEELNKTSILRYILAYDPDDAGRKGASRFKKFIRKDVFVDELKLPANKDINDLTKEEFERLLNEQCL